MTSKRAAPTPRPHPTLLGLPRKIRNRIYRHLYQSGALRIHFTCLFKGETFRDEALYQVTESNLDFSLGLVCKVLQQEATLAIYRLLALKLCHEGETPEAEMLKLSTTVTETMLQAKCRMHDEPYEGTELGKAMHENSHKLAPFVPGIVPQPLGPIILSLLPVVLRDNVRTVYIQSHHLNKIAPQLSTALPNIKTVVTAWHAQVSRPKKCTSKQVLNAYKTELTRKHDAHFGNMANGSLKILDQIHSDKHRTFAFIVEVAAVNKMKDVVAEATESLKRINLGKENKKEPAKEKNATPKLSGEAYKQKWAQMMRDAAAKRSLKAAGDAEDKDDADDSEESPRVSQEFDVVLYMTDCGTALHD